MYIYILICILYYYNIHRTESIWYRIWLILCACAYLCYLMCICLFVCYMYIYTCTFCNCRTCIHDASMDVGQAQGRRFEFFKDFLRCFEMMDTKASLGGVSNEHLGEPQILMVWNIILPGRLTMFRDRILFLTQLGVSIGEKSTPPYNYPTHSLPATQGCPVHLWGFGNTEHKVGAARPEHLGSSESDSNPPDFLHFWIDAFEEKGWVHVGPVSGQILFSSHDGSLVLYDVHSLFAVY